MYGDDLSKAPMHDLAEQGARQRLASQVNQKVLQSQSYPSDLLIEFYWKMAQFAESQLAADGLDFPHMTSTVDENLSGDVEMEKPQQ